MYLVNCSNRTFMDLKSVYAIQRTDHRRSNRTFMELKLQVNEIVSLVSR